MIRPLRFAVLGNPIAHSKSPDMHAAAYRARGLPHVYEKIATTEAELPERVKDLREGRFAGLNVTVPHKLRVLSLVDELDARVTATGAANTLVPIGNGRIKAYNTDVPALELEILRLGGKRTTDADAGLVIGSGGAARAALLALAALGFRRLHVRARAFDDRDAASAFVAESSRVLAGAGYAVTIVASSLAPSPEVEATVRAVVQATTAGMAGGAPGEVASSAVAWDALARAVALDVVYATTPTPFLAAAAARGLPADDGRGMLARQGALAFSLWLGGEPPFEVMRAALDRPAAAGGGERR